MQITQLDNHTAKALLEWQVEFGVDETMSETPVNRFEVKPEPKKTVPAAAPPKIEAGIAPVADKVDGVPPGGKRRRKSTRATATSVHAARSSRHYAGQG